MRRCSIFCALLVLVGVASGQNAPQLEVFAGYSYLNFDVPSVPTVLIEGKHLSLNGWEASASVDFLRHLGAEADFSGHYKGDCFGVSGLNCKEYSFLFGPRMVFGSPGKNRVSGFGHLLVGRDTISLGSSGLSASNGSLGADAGGGLDYWITRRWGIRLAQVDYLFSQHFHDLSVPVQHSYRASAGIVFAVGRKSSGSTRESSRASVSGMSRATMSIPSLGVMVSPPIEGREGAEVARIESGSVAELALLHVGDVINSIDGKPVKTPMELAAELANRTPGAQIRLGYMFRTAALGWFPRETVVILGGNH